MTERGNLALPQAFQILLTRPHQVTESQYIGVGKNLQGQMSPDPGSAQDHPKTRPYVWEQCPNAF